MIAPFPWDALDRVPREAAAALRDARRAVADAVDPVAVGSAIGSVAGTPASVLVRSVGVLSAPDDRPPIGVRLAFATRDGAARVSIDVERPLVAAILGAVLRRPVRVPDPSGVPDPAVAGAFAAIVAKVARAAHGDGAALVPAGPGAFRHAPGTRLVTIEATVLLGDEAYAASATVEPGRIAPGAAVAARDALRRLGDCPISLPVVCATSLAARADLRSLAPGDAWVPGDGAWWVTRAASGAIEGAVALAAPASDRGVRGSLRPGGDIVIEGARTVPIDAERTMTDDAGQGRDETAGADAAEGAVATAALDAPVIVRVEVGSVTLAAREWAAIAPGDVIACGRRVGEPVVLRVAGVEVGSGDLVDLSGELGVRIRRMGSGTVPPGDGR